MTVTQFTIERVNKVHQNEHVKEINDMGVYVQYIYLVKNSDQ